MSEDENIDNIFDDNFPTSVPKIEDGLFSDENLQDLVDWLTGMSSEPPSDVKKMMNNVATKLNVLIAYINIYNLKRMRNMIANMENIEQYMFSQEKLTSMDSKEMRIVYFEAQKSLIKSLEFSRKFVIQNKEDLKSAESGAEDKLKELLLSMPSGKVEVLEKLVNLPEEEMQEALSDLEKKVSGSENKDKTPSNLEEEGEQKEGN